MPVCLWERSDGEFLAREVNHAFCEFLDLERDEVLGATIAKLGGVSTRAKRDMSRTLSSGATITREAPYVRWDGDVRQLQIMYVAVAADQVLAFVFDVTGQRHTEQQLRVTESRYRTLVSAANEGVWLVSPAGRTTFANGSVGRLLGRPLAEIVSGNLLDYVHPDDRAAVAEALERPRGAPDAFEARLHHSDGRELLCLLSVSPMPGDGSGPTTLCVLADMTALQQERELRLDTERRFRRMVETANEGVWTGDHEGRTTFVNDALATMLGRDAGEMLGRPFTDFIVYDEDVIALRGGVRHDGEPRRAELRLVHADGSTLDAMASVTLQRDEHDKVSGSLVMLTDITQMKREQADLRESHERFAQVFEESPVGMVFIAAGHLTQGRLLGANRAFRNLLGYSEAELLEHDTLSLTHPDDAAIEGALAQGLYENRRAHYEIEKRFRRADGRFVWTHFRAHVLRDERGAPLYGLGVAVDITAQKEAAASALDAEARARAVLDATPDAVVEMGPDAMIAAMNDAALRIFGYEWREVAGRPIADVLVPERLRDRLTDAAQEWIAAAHAGRPIEATETTMTRADGSEFPAALTVSAAIGSESPRLTLYVRNLGIQDRAEAARREAEERFERLFRDGAAATVLIDLAGRVTDANAAFCKLAGRTSLELIGRDAGQVLADTGDAHEAPWEAGVERPGPLSAARRIERPDGRSLSVQITASLVRDAAGGPRHWISQCVPHGLVALGDAPEGDPLSYRERQVLGLLAKGQDGPAIAERLGLSTETVRSYANSARTKLSAKTRTEAVALALARGEISL